LFVRFVNRLPGERVVPGAGQLSGFHRRQASHGVLTDRFTRTSFQSSQPFLCAIEEGFCFHTSDHDLSREVRKTKATSERQKRAAALESSL
jgi:hypothetical protein